MKDKSIVWLCVFLFSFLAGSVQAQGDCQDALLSANEAFNLGKYAEVISLLDGKIEECSYTKESKLQALKILAAANSELDELETAEQLTQSFLHKDPTYSLQSIDPKQFKTLFNQFEVRPRFSLGISAGIQQAMFQVDKEFSVWDQEDYSSNYSSSYNFSVNLNLEWHASKRVSLITELGLSQINYTRNISYGDSYIMDFSENMLQVKATLLSSLNLFSGKHISFNVLAGVYGYKYSNVSQNYSNSYQGTTISTNEQTDLKRNLFGYGLVGGFKISRQKKQIGFSFQPRYYFSPTLVNDAQNRYDNSSFAASQLYVDDDFRINQLEFLVGVSYTFSYKIKHKYH